MIHPRHFCRPWHLALLIAITSASCVFGESPFDFSTNPGNLPKTVIPRNYTLRIEPNLPARTIQGKVRIAIEVLETVETIVLNAHELTIDRAVLLSGPNASDATPIALEATLLPDVQQLSLAPPAALEPGTYAIELDYQGRIFPNAEGFFFDSYPTASGPKEMFGTQFEVRDARRALPCWDEPAFRATFDATLVVPAAFSAFSNMPAVRETPLDRERKEIQFDRTPSMSTYLLAFFGGELETLEDNHHGIHLVIACTEGKTASAHYALESTKRILDYYAEYFGAPYPLPQLVQVGVPNAFSNFGAMENWGCIGYIDTLLLYDPAVMSQSDQEWVFKVIAHEIAHQWFGNLVTMGWWDNLWLNEGFASWVETKCTDALNPAWNTWLRSNSSKEDAFALDARKSTHAIQLPGITDASAMDSFDTISYEKGKAFIRMLEAFLGETPFREGIRLYLQRHAFSNTTTADLWAALGEMTKQPVAAVASGWTEQPGFPLVRATITDDQLSLTQERFILDDPDATALQWSIPVTYAALDALNRPASVLLSSAATTVPWPTPSVAPKLNVGDTGYYRVLYDEATFAHLATALPDLPEADQLNLLGDTWALVIAGHIASSDYLELAVALRHSTSQPVWDSLLSALTRVERWQYGSPGRPAFQRWLVDLVLPQFERIGWTATPDESPLTAGFRSQLIRVLGRSGHEPTIAACKRRFAQFLTDPTSLPADLRAPVLDMVGRTADEATFDQLNELARAATTTAEIRQAYGAMQHVQDPALVQRMLELSLSDELSAAERNANIQRIAYSSEDLAPVWRFAVEHAAALLATQPTFGINAYLPDIVWGANDPRYADELETVVRQHLGEAGLKEAAKTTSRIRINAAVRARELPAVDAWINRHSSPATP